MANGKVKTSPRDFFLNLLAVIALYISAAGVTTLLFQYINIIFPDPLDTAPPASGAGAIRFAVASLIVLFPVYLWTMRSLEREYSKKPALKNVRIRKWLVYFTLFAASLIILGDVVSLIMRFLEGELTARFFLKVLSIFLVAGVVFRYYIWDIRSEKKYRKNFIYAVIAVVAVLVVSSFFAIGSPAEQRRVQFDRERVSDLQFLQSEIVFYWQNKGALPEALSDLNDDIRGVTPPVDPVTGEEYEYELTGELAFRLCAVFETESASSTRIRRKTPFPEGADWSHDAGKKCFDREIDPDIYKRDVQSGAAIAPSVL